MSTKHLKLSLKYSLLLAITALLVVALIVRTRHRDEAPPINTLRSYPLHSDSYDLPINYTDSFEDLQDTQLVAAQACGINPLTQRMDVESHPKLVSVQDCPEFLLDTAMEYSSPYLTRDAAEFLRQLGDLTNQYAGTDQHRMIVTSLLRTEEDVSRLQHRNRNATTQSCHLYGTTFDITYMRFENCWTDRDLHNMQHALFAAAYDMRQSGYCFVKYERKQSCLHITLRPEN